MDIYKLGLKGRTGIRIIDDAGQRDYEDYRVLRRKRYRVAAV